MPKFRALSTAVWTRRDSFRWRFTETPYNTCPNETGANHRHTGQDGSYLADLLLKKGYEVHGIIRRASTFNTSRIDHLTLIPT